ncbi:hypothetical protein G6011_05573 [Alternaria panax]|uniref:G-protein coupled receptors family 2 profile 2 domain-containing protein n=1 Tax=Alternaria panax TaxID=48097 RepID=A0AAD4FCT8_9PLEO|nr:hypothetical protein G6011_05573 [Alternaria panax]
MATPLSHSRDIAIVVATRTASGLSVIGSTLIISTFVCFPFFRKPINRLVFFATFGNILTNIATLMSMAVLPKGSDPPSGLCEFQGLLIQWFLVSDSLFCLSMATNVFLVFFYGYDAQQLHHLEKWYIACSYGIPAVPVLAYFIMGRTGHQVIGSATLWCWVASDVEWMRIAFFYAPAWIMITATISIYVITGYRIWRKRVELRLLSRASHQFLHRDPSTAPSQHVRGSLVGINNIVVTTQIKCDIQTDYTILRGVSPEPDQTSISSFASNRFFSRPSRINDLATEPLSTSVPTRMSRTQIEDVEARQTLHEGTSRRNEYMATVVATCPTEDSPVVPATLSTSRPTVRRNAEGHAAAMAYFQVAFLMFLALFVVWLPSSINRMYQFTHKDHPSFALNIISAIVLPLQGAWNAIIYIFTTRAECRRAWDTVMSKLTGKPRQDRSPRGMCGKETMMSSQDTRHNAADIALVDVLKQAAHVRHSEVSDDDVAEKTKDQRGRESR